jgi:hypothetical protein
LRSSRLEREFASAYLYMSLFISRLVHASASLFTTLLIALV